MTTYEPDRITVQAITDSASTSGDCTFRAPPFYLTTDTYMKIPQGMKLVIGSRRAQTAGQATIFSLKESHDDGSTWTEIDRETLAANSQSATPLEMRKPLVVMGLTGLERFRVSWSGQGAGAFAALEFTFEYRMMDDED